jgi:hypothetical protein
MQHIAGTGTRLVCLWFQVSCRGVRRASGAASHTSRKDPLSLLLEGIKFEQQQNHCNFRGKTSYFADFQVQGESCEPWCCGAHSMRTRRGRQLDASFTGAVYLQVSILEELSMAGGMLTQSDLHVMLTRARRYRDMPLPERAATLEDIRSTLLGLRSRCSSGSSTS